MSDRARTGLTTGLVGTLPDMIGTRTLARTLISGIFVVAGANALRKPGDFVGTAKNVTDPLKESTGIDAQTEQLVKINGGVQVAAGSAFALGILPRPMAIALGVTVVPTTLAAHRFWELQGEEKQQQMIGFLKNAAILGGLVFAALDTGGRPSVFWTGKQAAGTAIDAIASGAHTAASSAQSAFDTVTP